MSGGRSIAAVALAVLLPPVGVWLARGLGPAFWVAVVLTLLGYLPGMIFAVLAVARPDLVMPRPRRLAT